MAAEQAAKLSEEKKLHVIPSRSVPEGISAMFCYEHDADPDEMEAAMKDAIQQVDTATVTYAVRDTVIDDKTITEGDIMGIGDSGILSVTKDIDSATLELIDALVDEDSELISIYYGEDVSEEDAEALAGQLEEKYPDVDVEVQNGGQPIYYYVLSVE